MIASKSFPYYLQNRFCLGFKLNPTMRGLWNGYEKGELYLRTNLTQELGENVDI